MSSAGAIAAANARSSARRIEEYHKQRRLEEERRRKAEAERKRKAEAERKRQETRRRQQKDQKKLMQELGHKQKQRSDDMEKTASVSATYEFTNVLRTKLSVLPIVHKGAYESILADGSRLSHMDSKYVQTFPDGRVREYDLGYQGDNLYLTREELPNGAMVVYENDKKVYECDEKGNYTRYKIDLDGNVTETIEGKISSEPVYEFTDVLRTKLSVLPIVHKGAYESILADGSRLSHMDSKYVQTFPDGRVREYDLGYQGDNLYLTREELPNGAMVAYKDDKKVYEKDENGNFVYEKTVYGKRIVTEGNDSGWKKTFYGYEEIPYYILSSELNKKYYLSGKLYEEQTDKGECFRYAENGVCLYEEDREGCYREYQLTPDEKDRVLIKKVDDHSVSEEYEYYPSGKIKSESINGQVRKYAENGVCLYEKDREGYYREYQLTPDEKDRVLIKKVDDYSVSEEYEYYPSGKIKSESINGQVREYAENGVCLYEEDREGFSRRYQLTPDGKDRLLIARIEDFFIKEKHEYYSSGKIKTSKYLDGSNIQYNEYGTYQKFDKKSRLKEETSAEGKTVYAYYQGTSNVEHVVKYDLDGKTIDSEYKHFDKEGKEDTAYYLSMKRIIANKIEKHDQKQAKKGIEPEARTVSKKMSKAGKLFAHIKAKIDSRNG